MPYFTIEDKTHSDSTLLHCIPSLICSDNIIDIENSGKEDFIIPFFYNL